MMGVARVNGCELYYEQFGAGEPILFMHGGLGLDLTSLRPYHDPLADSARLVYYDHRWCGRSGRVGEPDHAMWQDDAAGLLDALAIERATIYGHSYGAWLALGFALRYPQRVRRLVLCGASPAFDYAPDLARFERTHPAALNALTASFAQPPATDRELAALWTKILPMYFVGPVPPDLAARCHASAGGYARGSQALAGFTLVDRLGELRMPIDILTGSHDFITPIAQAQRLAALAPNVRVTEFAHSGHFPFIEQPDAYLHAFRAALATG